MPNKSLSTRGVITLSTLKLALASYSETPELLFNIYNNMVENLLYGPLLALTYLLKSQDPTDQGESPLCKQFELKDPLHNALYKAMQPLTYEREAVHLHALLGDFDIEGSPSLETLLAYPERDGILSLSDNRYGLTAAQYIAWFHPERIRDITLPEAENGFGSLTDIFGSHTDDPSGLRTLSGELAPLNTNLWILALMTPKGHFPTANLLKRHHPLLHRQEYNNQKIQEFLKKLSDTENFRPFLCELENIKAVKAHFLQALAAHYRIDARDRQTCLLRVLDKLEHAANYYQSKATDQPIGLLLLTWLYPNLPLPSEDSEAAEALRSVLLQEVASLENANFTPTKRLPKDYLPSGFSASLKEAELDTHIAISLLTQSHWSLESHFQGKNIVLFMEKLTIEKVSALRFFTEEKIISLFQETIFLSHCTHRTKQAIVKTVFNRNKTASFITESMLKNASAQELEDWAIIARLPPNQMARLREHWDFSQPKLLPLIAPENFVALEHWGAIFLRQLLNNHEIASLYPVQPLHLLPLEQLELESINRLQASFPNVANLKEAHFKALVELSELTRPRLEKLFEYIITKNSQPYQFDKLLGQMSHALYTTAEAEYPELRTLFLNIILKAPIKVDPKTIPTTLSIDSQPLHSFLKETLGEQGAPNFWKKWLNMPSPEPTGQAACEILMKFQDAVSQNSYANLHHLRLEDLQGLPLKYRANLAKLRPEQALLTRDEHQALLIQYCMSDRRPSEDYLKMKEFRQSHEPNDETQLYESDVLFLKLLFTSNEVENPIISKPTLRGPRPLSLTQLTGLLRSLRPQTQAEVGTPVEIFRDQWHLLYQTKGTKKVAARNFFNKIIQEHPKLLYDAWTKTSIPSHHAEFFVQLICCFSPEFLSNQKALTLPNVKVTDLNVMLKILMSPNFYITKQFIQTQEANIFLNFKLYFKLHLQSVNSEAHWTTRWMQAVKAYLMAFVSLLPSWWPQFNPPPPRPVAASTIHSMEAAAEKKGNQTRQEAPRSESNESLANSYQAPAINI